MRIDELDPKHKEFKKVILDHDLTEEQLDEILPAVAAVGAGLARGAMAVGGLAARGAAAVARGVGSAVGTVARGVGQAANTIGRTVGNTTRSIGRNTTQKIKKTAQNQINKKVNSLKTNTANKLSGRSNQSGGGNDNTSQSTTGTTGTTGSQSPQAQLQRGSEFNLPVTDPKQPMKTRMTPMKVKNVTGSNVEFEPKKKEKGLPQSVKFNKKDLNLK